ncbi:MAG: oxidoreductase, partial [Bacteroidales bacterium]|nr:oxidoreductase [Bacteroidales bacterium]
TYRSITVEGQALDFSSGFTDLHTLTYQHILDGKGLGLDCARPSIEIVHHIRNAELSHAVSADKHSFVNI